MNTKTNKKTIFFTGGGSGGHVVPALTLIEKIDRDLYDVHYIGSKEGIESKLTKNKVSKYHSIKVGKLRRYFSFQNMLDILNVFIGLIQAFFTIAAHKSKDSIIISMGGFVSVPVVIAAKLNGLDIFIHEQTTRVGLANKIGSKFAKKVMVSFKDSLKFFPSDKVIYTGYPVRDSFYNQEIEVEEIDKFNFMKKDKPLLFITGGGNGAELINTQIKKDLSLLKRDFYIVHQVGQNCIEEYLSYADQDYMPVAFIGDEMPSLLKAAAVIISRSGAGTVSELLSIGKRSIFIPLKIAQKNEQYHNAMEAQKLLKSVVISEDELHRVSIANIIKRFQAEDSHQSLKNVEKQLNKASEIIIKECSLVLNKSV